MASTLLACIDGGGKSAPSDAQPIFVDNTSLVDAFALMDEFDQDIVSPLTATGARLANLEGIVDHYLLGDGVVVESGVLANSQFLKQHVVELPDRFFRCEIPEDLRSLCYNFGNSFWQLMQGAETTTVNQPNAEYVNLVRIGQLHDPIIDRFIDKSSYLSNDGLFDEIGYRVDRMRFRVGVLHALKMRLRLPLLIHHSRTSVTSVTNSTNLRADFLTRAKEFLLHLDESFESSPKPTAGPLGLFDLTERPALVHWVYSESRKNGMRFSTQLAALRSDRGVRDFRNKCMDLKDSPPHAIERYRNELKCFINSLGGSLSAQKASLFTLKLPLVTVQIPVPHEWKRTFENLVEPHKHFVYRFISRGSL